MNEDDDNIQYPAHYLKCEKLVAGNWVTTGWAPNLKAAEQHAVAIGGAVRAVTNNGIEVYNRLDSESELCDTSCPEHD